MTDLYYIGPLSYFVSFAQGIRSMRELFLISSRKPLAGDALPGTTKLLVFLIAWSLSILKTDATCEAKNILLTPQRTQIHKYRYIYAIDCNGPERPSFYYRHVTVAVSVHSASLSFYGTKQSCEYINTCLVRVAPNGKKNFHTH